MSDSFCFLSFLVVIFCQTPFCAGLQPSHHQQQQSSSLPGSPVLAADETLVVDADRFKKTIAQGRVYQHSDFLSPDQISGLLNEIDDLQQSGAFALSGLSNTAMGSQQGFGNKDRSVGAVPWWKDLLLGNLVKNEQDTTKTTTATATVHSAAFKIDCLRRQVGTLLNRPTMLDPTLAHECYYSTSTRGSFLPRHMDERHEELKGAKGWLLPSRRSLSWLIYLSDDNWTLSENGGALRSFPQAKIVKPPPSTLSASATTTTTTSHNGNLQIGWLLNSAPNGGSCPIYLNSWYTPVLPLPDRSNTTTSSVLGTFSTSSQSTSIPHCILYTVVTDDDDDSSRSNNPNGVMIQPLTKPWLTDGLRGTTVADFLHRAAQMDQRQLSSSSSTTLFLRPHDAKNFALLEDRSAWEKGELPAGSIIEDINPERGLLVVFDSVLLPHQVEEIKRGRRAALAGWFHEETQKFPEEFYS